MIVSNTNMVEAAHMYGKVNTRSSDCGIILFCPYHGPNNTIDRNVTSMSTVLCNS